MAQQQSKLPSGEQLSKPMVAYLQNIEARRPSNTTPLDVDTATPAVIAERFNQLLIDLSR